MDRHYKDNKFIPVSHKMHNYIRNRGSSVSKLPPIHKIPLLKQSPKQKIKGIDISLDLLHNYSKPRIMSNGSSSRVYKKPSTHAKLRSSRRRTDSIGSQLNLHANFQHGSFDVNSPHSQVESGNVMEKTLENFHRNIKINREYIHKEIRKRNEEKLKECKENQQIRKDTERTQKKKKDTSKQIVRRFATEQSAIFDNINHIINSKMVNKSDKIPSAKRIETDNQNINLNKIRNMIKMTKLNKAIQRMSPNESISELKRSYQQQNSRSSRVLLKDENNYHEWRRVDISSNEKNPKYRVSTFEEQNQRLEQFVIRNEISLSKYLQYRKQLFFCQPIKIKTSNS